MTAIRDHQHVVAVIKALKHCVFLVPYMGFMGDPWSWISSIEESIVGSEAGCQEGCGASMTGR